MSFPYVQSQDKFAEFLKKLPTIGVPASFDKKVLKSIGYTSSNDERFLQAIKYIGLVENKRGGSPTDLWKKMRADFGTALGEGIVSGYADLFTMYENANQLDAEALQNYFAANTDAGSVAVARMVATFQTLVGLASFEGSESPSPEESIELSKSRDATANKPHDMQARVPASSININIQLQLPADSKGDVYDRFFESMKKHLMSDDS